MPRSYSAPLQSQTQFKISVSVLSRVVKKQHAALAGAQHELKVNIGIKGGGRM